MFGIDDGLGSFFITSQVSSNQYGVAIDNEAVWQAVYGDFSRCILRGDAISVAVKVKACLFVDALIVDDRAVVWQDRKRLHRRFLTFFI